MLADGAQEPPADGFEVGYVEQDGSGLRRPLADVWSVRFEGVAPVRAFKSHKGQRHLPGLWWSTADGHIGYESWLERDHVTRHLDVAHAVTCLTSTDLRVGGLDYPPALAAALWPLDDIAARHDRLAGLAQVCLDRRPVPRLFVQYEVLLASIPERLT
ncbi:hypothetical protein ACFT7S_33265 [Streptomyces sp. NPDC057136]|uniref:hypothetical protein n=1 Tax=Streptomyces sp. NPDC057136 TaxID=3346029 RepID=UPI00362FA070